MLDYNQNSALHLAARVNALDCVKVLLSDKHGNLSSFNLFGVLTKKTGVWHPDIAKELDHVMRARSKETIKGVETVPDPKCCGKLPEDVK